MTEKGPLMSVTGGTLNVQALAVGNRARAVVKRAKMNVNQPSGDELTKRLDEVLDAIQSHGAALPDPSTANALVERIATESAKKAPDKLTLKTFLSSLAEQVSSVGTIAKTVAALGTTIGTIWP